MGVRPGVAGRPSAGRTAARAGLRRRANRRARLHRTERGGDLRRAHRRRPQLYRRTRLPLRESPDRCGLLDQPLLRGPRRYPHGRRRPHRCAHLHPRVQPPHVHRPPGLQAGPLEQGHHHRRRRVDRLERHHPRRRHHRGPRRDQCRRRRHQRRPRLCRRRRQPGTGHPRPSDRHPLRVGPTWSPGCRPSPSAPASRPATCWHAASRTAGPKHSDTARAASTIPTR